MVILLCTPARANATSFRDVTADDWFAEAVHALANAKIINGRDDGTFGPYDPVTRAEFSVLVVRCLNLPDGTHHPFIDFPHGVWFEPAVAALYQAGLANGRSANEFAPYSTITRQQAVTLAVRALAYRLEQRPIEGLDLALSPADVEAWLQGFPDRASIAEVHRTAAANAYRLQLLAGQSDAGFRPVAPMTRSETAALLYAALFQTPVPLTELPIPEPSEPYTPSSSEPSTPTQPQPGSAPAYQPAAVGSQGAHVLWLEQRLTELSYRPGPADGVFDERTRQAVIAFQKWEGLSRSGTVGLETWDRLLVAGTPKPRLAGSGIWIEVNLAKQVFLYVQNGSVARTLATSTGASFTYRSAPYTVERKPIPDGPRYRALYLNPGNVLAIHGYPYVPTYPASHGCIRLTKWDMDDLRVYDSTNPMIPDGTKVYIY
jgi:peptidoglycan hydrolase-like protein with peptidoglycan-binding domain